MLICDRRRLGFRAGYISQYPLLALKVFGIGLRHKLTNQAGRITEVRSGDGQVHKASDYLSEPLRVASHSRHGFALYHTELEEHTQHIVPLVDQYAFRDPE